MSRVKQAYCLNEHEAQSLLHELSPDSVYPYELWQKAYSTFWKIPAAEYSRLYNVDNPPFPEIHQLSENYFPTEAYAKWMVDFFFEMARRISVRALESGFDYIIESIYDNKSSVSDADREYLFYPLMLAEKNVNNATRIEGVKDINVKLSSPNVLLNIFPDTIAVDKIAAIRYLSVQNDFPLVQEVKGITRALVDSVVKAAVQEMSPVPATAPALKESATDMQPQGQNPSSIPRLLWQGKSKEFIYATLREKGWDNLDIAYVLFHKRGFTQKRAIGKLLHDNPNLTDSAYDKYGKQLFDDSKHISIIDVDDL